MWELIKDFTEFMAQRKKFWLLPIVIVMLLPQWVARVWPPCKLLAFRLVVLEESIIAAGVRRVVDILLCQESPHRDRDVRKRER